MAGRRPNPGAYHRNSHQNRANLIRAAADVRLSQCMIVKNEEKNIERALSWAKDIAFEQIVVDTGSTDRTVEIAESMGATVYHFAWIDDFAAAKNFAIEKARGNWIAFLDADEWIEPEGVPNLRRSVEQTNRNTQIAALFCDWLQLRDDGSTFMVYEQSRIFRKHVRYSGRIHEQLVFSPGEIMSRMPDVQIMHTGYTDAAYAETNKSERNIRLIRGELEKKPGDMKLKGYLADALSVSKDDPEKLAEAELIYLEIVAYDQPLEELMIRSAYDDLLTRARAKNDADEIIALSPGAIGKLPRVPDYHYYYGLALRAKGRYREAFERFKECEHVIETVKDIQNRMTPSALYDMFAEMSRLALVLGDTAASIEYASLTLVSDKYRKDILVQLLSVMNAVQSAGLSKDSERIQFLTQFYDFGDARDKLFLAQCAKAAKDEVLMIYFYRTLTDAEKAALAAEPPE
ncbi:MAG: glycosyltransferase family 2 protein [Oscillospiraceae bacterium]|jgi:glycosyltransferase involved in cell wall biosynthesis|nr:glycosyltransferase family 2 protein [Oscillospiraceae bacterium]